MAPVSSRLLRLPVPDSDVALVTALRAGRADARGALFDRYAGDVERVLYRVLGPDPDVLDILQDVFVVALTSLRQLNEPSALRSWLIGIAIRKARKVIHKRRRWRFLQLFPPDRLPEREAVIVPAEVSEALRAVYRILGQLPADDRIVFALRHVDGMELGVIADTCGVSLSTVKRRLSRGQRRFMELAEDCAALAEWLKRGDFTP